LIYPDHVSSPQRERIARSHLGQEGLRAYGLSGDLPMLVVTLSDSRDLPLVREILIAHAYWRSHGLISDLVILDQHSSRETSLQGDILRLIQSHDPSTGTDRPGGVFLRDGHAIPEEHKTLILGSANVALSSRRGSFRHQLPSSSDVRRIPAHERF